MKQFLASVIHKLILIGLIVYLIWSVPMALFTIPWLLVMVTASGFQLTPFFILVAFAGFLQVMAFIIYPVFVWKFYKQRSDAAKWLNLYFFTSLFFPILSLAQQYYLGQGDNLVIGSSMTLNQMDLSRILSIISVWIAIFILLKVAN